METRYTLEDYLTIQNNMKRYGGSFVKALGNALMCADYKNREKLANTFSEYFEEYLRFGS